MTPFPHAVELMAPLELSRQVMDEHNVRHLPVTRKGRLAGGLHL